MPITLGWIIPCCSSTCCVGGGIGHYILPTYASRRLRVCISKGGKERRAVEYIPKKLCSRVIYPSRILGGNLSEEDQGQRMGITNSAFCVLPEVWQ